jgi:hypothetical protein
MITVKKLTPETVIERYALPSGKTVTIRSPKTTCWAVMNEQNVILLSSTQQREIYRSKATAQKVADWYNAHA